jgi:hypothetical protein
MGPEGWSDGNGFGISSRPAKSRGISDSSGPGQVREALASSPGGRITGECRQSIRPQIEPEHEAQMAGIARVTRLTVSGPPAPGSGIP